MPQSRGGDLMSVACGCEDAIKVYKAVVRSGLDSKGCLDEALLRTAAREYPYTIEVISRSTILQCLRAFAQSIILHVFVGLM